MQLEELREAKDSGSDDPQLRADLQRAKSDFDAKLAATDASLATLHTQWDTALDADDQAAKAAARDAMVALLNRRSYLRNLVRDVNDALEP
jgi:molecular chaperone HscB